MSYHCKSQKFVESLESKKAKNGKHNIHNQLRFPNPLNNNEARNMDIQCKVLKQLSQHEYLTPQMVNAIKLPINAHVSKRPSSFQKQLAMMQQVVKKQQKKCQAFVQPIIHKNWLRSNQIDDLLDLGFQSSEHHLNINTFLYNKTECDQENQQPINFLAKTKQQKHVGFEMQNIIEEQNTAYYKKNNSRGSHTNNCDYSNSGKSIDMLSENYENLNCAPVYYSQYHINFDDIMDQETNLGSEIGISHLNSIADLPLYSLNMIADNFEQLPLYSRHHINFQNQDYQMMAE